MASGSDLKKGYWTKEEDSLLKQHIQRHGEGRWSDIPKTADNEVKNYWYSRLKHRVLGNKVTRPLVTRLTAKPLNNPDKSSLPTEIESEKIAAIWKDTRTEAQEQHIGEENENPSKFHAIERDGIPSCQSASFADELLSPFNFYLFEETIPLLDLRCEQWL
ncbi:hypothetical protein SUGI_0919150 [Cryptomeria japonica]|nr:hypothetical protein SUGI_0919150 [Cryptomeria japonica]